MSGRRAVRGSKSVSYAEDSDSSDSDVPLVKARSSRPQADPSSRASTSARRQRTATNDASPRAWKRRQTSNKMVIGRPRPANSVRGRTQARLPSNLPRWPAPAKLPYDVLLSIFQYAAYPLVGTTSASWLVKIAMLRRDFLEPAMAALYYCPPLEPATRAHRLMNALNAQTESSLVDYRRKIRYLEIPVREVLLHKCAGRDPLDLAQMITVMPMLRGARVNWITDDPANFSLLNSGGTQTPGSKAISWYGEHIWRLLDENKMQLSHWKWNCAFRPPGDWPWDRLREIHQRPAFQIVKSMEINGTVSVHQIHPLTRALGELKQLQHLTLSKLSYQADDQFVQMLEVTGPLVSLSLVHCTMLTSDGVVGILRNNGSALRHLTLSHNMSLDLAFLGELATLTPGLHSLTMDLTFFSQLSTVRTADPQFTCLLPDNCTPTWPRTLQRLQLVHLRKWDTNAAYTFLNSLVEAAPELRDLRYLGIRMSVDADWRDRVKFRNVWEQRMRRVFQRRSAPPRRWTSGGSGAGSGGGGGSALKKSARQASQRSEITDEEEGGENGAGGEHNSRSTPIAQGMCDRVDVRIENLRPMDQLLDESNFLDEEKSGDEDYRD